MLSLIKNRLSGSIKRRLYLLTAIVSVIMFIMVLVFIWAGNTLTMITAIARFERTHTISRVEAFNSIDKFYDHKNPADLNEFKEKWAITQSYNGVFGSLLDMRTTKSKKEFADFIEKTFTEADRYTSEILVNRIHLLYWHPLIIEIVDIAKRAHKLGLRTNDQVKVLLETDNVAIKKAALKEIEHNEKSFRTLENDFSNKTGQLGHEISFFIKMLSIGLLILSVGLTSLLAFLTIHSITIPMGRFIAYSKEIANGNIDAEMPDISSDELQSLSESMTILLNLNQRLKHEIDEKTQMAQKLVEANRQIAESELKQLTMISNISDVIGIIDTDGKMTYKSPNIEKWFGWQPQDVIGTDGLLTVHPDDLKRIRNVFFTLLKEENSTQQVEYRYKCKDGSYKPIELTATNLSNNPVIKGVLLNYHDISQRMQVEEKLKESEALYSTTLDALNDGVWDWNVVTGNAFFSPRYYMMLGYENNEFIASYASWRPLVHPEDIDRVERDLQQAIETGCGFRIDLRMATKSGEWRWVCTRGKAIERDTDGKVLRMVGTLSDITDRKLIEAESLNLRDQLAQTQKIESIGRLAGGVAHDFNNMLSIIMGYSEMTLESLSASPILQENIREIISASQRATNVVRQLLAFARKQTIAPKVLDLNDTIADILKMLRRLIGEDIDLLWKPASNVWPVKMDPSQIDQLLANLTVNARDAIDDVGKVTIETANVTFDTAYCKTHDGFKPGDFVVISVSDNGCGMDKETQATIFEPFFTTKEIGKGTGLGLSTVYGIIKQNDGFINVYSEPGQGSTFRIYIPRCQQMEVEAAKKSKSASIPTGTETILLVEDEQSILKLGMTMLERMGYTVLAAHTPSEAIRLAEEHKGEIHLVMTDVVMPEMNGRDLSNQLIFRYPKLKRLFMSGYTANVIAHHGVLDEGVHFIQKPFSKHDLAVKVREALEND